MNVLSGMYFLPVIYMSTICWSNDCGSSGNVEYLSCYYTSCHKKLGTENGFLVHATSEYSWSFFTDKHSQKLTHIAARTIKHAPTDIESFLKNPKIL